MEGVAQPRRLSEYTKHKKRLNIFGRRLRVFKNRVLRKVFGPKRDEVTGNGESCITRS